MEQDNKSRIEIVFRINFGICNNLGSFKKKRKNLRKKNNVNHNRLEGHFEKQQNDRTRIKKPLVCFDCGENGHMRFECPKKGKTEPFIQSKVCEIKKAKTGPKLEYVEPMNLDKRLKLIFLNKSEMKDLGEDVTLPTLIKYMNDSQSKYKSSLALIDEGVNKTPITYNMAETMGWNIDELDKVKIRLAGNVEGTLKKCYKIKILLIQVEFEVEL